jgi:uncharacterized membrane protein
MITRSGKILSLAVFIFFVLSNVVTVGSTAEPAQQSAAANNGFTLAWIIMGLLVLVLVYALVSAVLAAFGTELAVLPTGTANLVPVVALLGLGVAFYMTYIETQNVVPICGPIGDCNTVQSSRYAILFGVLPVGLLGALGYVAILIAWAAGRFAPPALARLAALALLGMALFGVIFSIYLTYLELFMIRAVCMWCLSSALLISLVLAFSVRPAVGAMLGGENEG